MDGGPEVPGRTQNRLHTYPATSLSRSLAMRGTSALTSGGLRFVCGTQHGALRVRTAWGVLEPLSNIVRHDMQDTDLASRWYAAPQRPAVLASEVESAFGDAAERAARVVDVSSVTTKLKSTPHIPHKLPASRFRHPTPPRAHVCAGLLSEPPPPAPHRKAVWVPDGENSVGEVPRGT